MFQYLGDVNERSSILSAFRLGLHEKALQNKYCIQSAPATTEAILLFPKETMGLCDL